MNHHVGSKGQIVIPKDLGERTGLLPGAAVDFELQGDCVVLSARQDRPQLGGRFAGSGMAARLLQDRADEPR